jgi:hypothetical protein
MASPAFRRKSCQKQRNLPFFNHLRKAACREEGGVPDLARLMLNRKVIAFRLHDRWTASEPSPANAIAK